MKQITSILTLSLCMFFSYALNAQTTQKSNGSKKDRVQQFKIAMITNELSLTSEEAERFWPLYNEMTRDMRESKRNRKRQVSALRNGYETMSDEEVERATLEILNAEIEEQEKRKAHLLKISNAVGSKKVVQLMIIEKKFKKQLLDKVQQQNSGK